MDADTVKSLARETGFDLVGITSTGPTPAAAFYPEWLAAGYHGEMRYLEGRRGVLRSEARQLLASAKSLISLGLIYDTRQPYTPDVEFTSQAWVSRYAWGADYHEVVRRLLHQLVERIEKQTGPFEHKVCVDTAPLLERAYAAQAGLGWIGKNTLLLISKTLMQFHFKVALDCISFFGVTLPNSVKKGTCRLIKNNFFPAQVTKTESTL